MPEPAEMITPVKRKLLAVARAKSPFIADCISGWKMYKHTKRYHWQEQNRFLKYYFGKSGPYVLSGPFQGMRYENRTYFGPVTPRWIGSYESELHSVIYSMRETDFDFIVDIGAAEGYYSIGFARLFPKTHVHSYETNPLSLWQQARLKRLNNTKNLTIRRYCSPSLLRSYGKYRCLIIADIEGSELELFSLEVCRSLALCCVLIELHNTSSMDVNAAGSMLNSYFESTHSVRFIESLARTTDDITIPYPSNLSQNDVLSAMNEYRSHVQKWMVCVPKCLPLVDQLGSGF